MTRFRNVFACLVHEQQDCVVDLIRNLRHLDPESTILLYNGGTDPSLLTRSFPFERYGAIVHPSPHPTPWGRLHEFALECMSFALEHEPFDALTIVDSDQLATRPGYSARIRDFLSRHPRAGLLGDTPMVQSPHTAAPPAVAAFREIELWRPFLQRFQDGEAQFVRWSFWPSTVFTADAARELTRLFSTDEQLRDIMRRTQIWATEEVILPTLVALVGLETLPNPCSYDFVKYRTSYSEVHAAAAMSRPDVFWMHPVPRRYGDAVRAYIRGRLTHYQQPAVVAHDATNSPSEPPLRSTFQVLAAMRKAEGWLEDDEADILLTAADRALRSLDGSAIVEVGSYCGRSTIVLGSAVRAAGTLGRVYAVDPHDGCVGALDQGLQYAAPTFHRFQQNIAEAGLGDVVEPVQCRSFEVLWEKPIAMLFIDGLHDYVNVARDFHHFERWLVDGAYVAFHDYADYYPGVKAFVDELVASGTYESAGCARSLIVLRRRAASATGNIEAAQPASQPDEPSVAVSPSVPLVSCIMPTADRPLFVPQAINYFLRQDYPNRELIVIDDGVESVRGMMPDDPRVRYVRLDRRQTMGSKHNLACEMAHGEIICHWDDDDWNADWRVSYQVQELLRCPPMTLSGLSHLLFYEPATTRAWQYIYPPNERPWVGGNTLCYRKTFWDRHKFPDMNEGADTIFVWSLTDAHVLPLPDYRFFAAIVHASNTSPKRTQGFGWHPCDTNEVELLIKDDCAFYDRCRAAIRAAI